MTEETRRLTNSERAAFAGQIDLQSVPARLVVGVAIILGCMVATATVMVLVAPRLSSADQAVVLWIAVASSFVLAILVDARTKYPASSTKLVNELREGIALVSTFDIVDAVRVKELEDNGYAFYLKLADNRVLFLMGQYLYKLTDDHQFPCTRIEVAYSPLSRLVLSIKCFGVYLPPTAELEAPTLTDFESGRVDRDGEIVDVSFEGLKNRAAQSREMLT
jgi:hypothetical protein